MSGFFGTLLAWLELGLAEARAGAVLEDVSLAKLEGEGLESSRASAQLILAVWRAKGGALKGLGLAGGLDWGIFLTGTGGGLWKGARADSQCPWAKARAMVWKAKAGLDQPKLKALWRRRPLRWEDRKPGQTSCLARGIHSLEPN